MCLHGSSCVHTRRGVTFDLFTGVVVQQPNGKLRFFDKAISKMPMHCGFVGLYDLYIKSQFCAPRGRNSKHSSYNVKA